MTNLFAARSSGNAFAFRALSYHAPCSWSMALRVKLTVGVSLIGNTGIMCHLFEVRALLAVRRNIRHVSHVYQGEWQWQRKVVKSVQWHFLVWNSMDRLRRACDIYLGERMLFSSRVRVRIGLRIRFVAWLVSGYARVFTCILKLSLSLRNRVIQGSPESNSLPNYK